MLEDPRSYTSGKPPNIAAVVTHTRSCISWICAAGSSRPESITLRHCAWHKIDSRALSHGVRHRTREAAESMFDAAGPIPRSASADGLADERAAGAIHLEGGHETAQDLGLDALPEVSVKTSNNKRTGRSSVTYRSGETHIYTPAPRGQQAAETGNRDVGEAVMSPLGSRTSRWTPRAAPDEAHGVVRALVGALVDVRDGQVLAGHHQKRLRCAIGDLQSIVDDHEAHVSAEAGRGRRTSAAAVRQDLAGDEEHLVRVS